MTAGGRRATKAALSVVLMVALAVAVFPAPVAGTPGTLTITMRDLAFEPGSFSVAPGESVGLTLINAGALTHTFTLFAQVDANIPVSDINALQNYYDANTKIVDLSLAKGEQRSIAFTAPMTAGTYTFVCMVPGHAGGGMHGTMTANVPLTAALRVGTILPLTGALGFFGPPMRDAADLAAGEVNATGVLGGSVELLHRDSQTDPTAARNAAAELVFAEGVPAIIGAASSGVSLAVTDVTLPNEVVQISPASTSPLFDTVEPAEPGWFWRTVPTDALQGRVAALYAYNDQGWRNVSILARDDTYGSGLADTFQDTFEGLGGTITVRVDYDPLATSFNTELTTVFASNPEAVWWVAFPGEGELIMQQWWANPAWRGPSWLWTEATKFQGFVDDLITQGIGVEGMEGTSPIRNGPNYGTFRTRFLAEYGREPHLFTAHTYDALYLAALAAIAREAVDSLSIRDSLIAVANPPGTVVGPGPQEFARAVGLLEAGGNIDYEGASGRVNFDLVGNVGSDYEIWNISAAGQIQQVDMIPEEEVRPPTPGTTAPTASFTATPPSGDVTTTFAVDASASSDAEDPATALEVQWDWEDDGIWDTIWTGQKTAEHQYASSGTYTIRMKVRDTGTLMASTTRQVEVAPLDTTNPTIAVVSPSDNATLTSASVMVTGTAADDVAVDKVEVSADGTNWVLATGTTSWSAALTLAEGGNTIFARATDTSGNAATTSIAVTVVTPTPDQPISPLVIAVGIGAGVAAVAAVAALLILRSRGKRKGEG
ncbi:MAG: ABC transporter substrate-binding protein [Thermoplasmata archaeon]